MSLASSISNVSAASELMVLVDRVRLVTGGNYLLLERVLGPRLSPGVGLSKGRTIGGSEGRSIGGSEYRRIGVSGATSSVSTRVSEFRHVYEEHKEHQGASYVTTRSFSTDKPS